MIHYRGRTCCSLAIAAVLCVQLCTGIRRQVGILILDQPTEIHRDASQNLLEQLLKTNASISENGKLALKSVLTAVFTLQKDFREITGAWAVWPVLGNLGKLHENGIDYLFVCEAETKVNLQSLLEFISTLRPEKDHFIGSALQDETSTIIHHYAFAGSDPSVFLYPDFSGGLVISKRAVKQIVDLAMKGDKRDFTIDAKHEFAMMLWASGEGIKLISSSQFCLKESPGCIAMFQPFVCPDNVLGLQVQNLYFAVKTCHKHHKNRIVVVKRTWAKNAVNIDYFSDVEDRYIPTTVFPNIPNTERGHCGKTFAILEHFRDHSDKNLIWWLVIADDDTLLSVPRLRDLLKCYDPAERLIIGERYGFGFDAKGQAGYDYPTGGSGMIFTRSAVESLLQTCSCPSVDSPDDMIIAMHQARPPDYAKAYIAKLKPISFHKHWEIDPYLVYQTYLDEEKKPKSTKKEEL